jgi:hypothetical protein
MPWIWLAGVHGENSSGRGVYGYGTGSGVFGSNISATGNAVYGYNNSSGVGVKGESNTGVGVYAKSFSGNLIEAWDSNPSDRRFYVTNVGQVYADGSFTGGGADMAEMLPAVDGLEPGDVLIIGPNTKLTRSTTPNASNVAGVYSTQPGFLGSASDDDDSTGKIPLAILTVLGKVLGSLENGTGTIQVLVTLQ